MDEVYILIITLIFYPIISNFSKRSPFTIDADIGQQVQVGANIAIYEINRNNEILPNFTIVPLIEDSKGIESNVVHNVR